MKIMPKSPKYFLSPTGREKSRLGTMVQEISLSELTQKKPGVVIFGIPDDKAIHNVGGRGGAKEAPDMIRTKLYRFTGKIFSFPVYDLGNLESQEQITETHERAKLVLEEIRRTGHLPIILGGGHDLAYPEAISLIDDKKKFSYGFLNIDAHLDLRNTDNGITSGSPWFLLLENPLFKKHKGKLVEFGIQSHCNIDELFAYAKKHSVEILAWEKVQKNPSRSFTAALKKLAVKNKILVSLDIDSVKSSDAPGCSAPQTSGFSAESVIHFSYESGKHKKVYSFGIYEVSPCLDQDNRTSVLAAHCVHSFLKGFEMRK